MYKSYKLDNKDNVSNSTLESFQLIVGLSNSNNTHRLACVAEGHSLRTGEPAREKIKKCNWGSLSRFQAQPCPSIGPPLMHRQLHLALSSICGAPPDMPSGAADHPCACLPP